MANSTRRARRKKSSVPAEAEESESDQKSPGGVRNDDTDDGEHGGGGGDNNDDESGSDAPEAGESGRGSSSPKNMKEKAPSLRKRRGEELRRHNLGVGLRIPADGGAPAGAGVGNKKITFSDDFDADAHDSGRDEGVDDGVDTSDDDNSAVEEVTGNAAMEEALRLEAEREAAARRGAATQKKQKKRRKRKEEAVAEQPSDEDDDDGDETEGSGDDEDEGPGADFFDRVDTEREGRRGRRREERKAEKRSRLLEAGRVGRHTTFVADVDCDDDGDDARGRRPIDAGHNIEVVVLKDASSSVAHGEDSGAREAAALKLSAGLGTAPSGAAHVFARGRLVGGVTKGAASAPSSRGGVGRQNGKKRGRGGGGGGGGERGPWKRSMKLTGAPALNFLVRSKAK